MEQKEYTEIDLRELLHIMLKRWWLIVIITVLVTVTSGIISYQFLTPQYEASAEILVIQSSTNNSSIDRNDIQTSLDLMNTYQVVIESPRILDKVIEEYDLQTTFGQLHQKISVSNVGNSQVMSISVTDPSYQEAVYIANAVATVFQRDIINLMNVDNVHIMAEAQQQSNPQQVSPHPTLNMAIAFVVGLMISIGLIFLLEYFNTSLKTEEDVQRELGVPVLGTIALMDESTKRKKRTRRDISRSTGGEHLNA